MGSGPQGVLDGIRKEEKEVLCWGPCPVSCCLMEERLWLLWGVEMNCRGKTENKDERQCRVVPSDAVVLCPCTSACGHTLLQSAGMAFLKARSHKPGASWDGPGKVGQVR